MTWAMGFAPHWDRFQCELHVNVHGQRPRRLRQRRRQWRRGAVFVPELMFPAPVAALKRGLFDVFICGAPIWQSQHLPLRAILLPSPLTPPHPHPVSVGEIRNHSVGFQPVAFIIIIIIFFALSCYGWISKKNGLIHFYGVEGISSRCHPPPTAFCLQEFRWIQKWRC